MGASGRINGSTPQLNRGAEGVGYKALFHSVREVALILDKTAKAGFGMLRAGTVMAVDSVGSYLVPYITDLHTDTNVGRAYLVTDVASASNLIYMTLADSYKFIVGDKIALVRDNGGSPQYFDGGPITAIDRTTDPSRAKITMTTAIAAVTTFSVANKVNAYHQSSASGKFSTAMYIIDQDIDTGAGEGAKGAQTSVVISNCILYKNALTNYDAQALTDLGGKADGRFVILK